MTEVTKVHCFNGDGKGRLITARSDLFSIVFRIIYFSLFGVHLSKWPTYKSITSNE